VTESPAAASIAKRHVRATVMVRLSSDSAGHSGPTSLRRPGAAEEVIVSPPATVPDYFGIAWYVTYDSQDHAGQSPP
jgi:hypothetical protein